MLADTSASTGNTVDNCINRMFGSFKLLMQLNDAVVYQQSMFERRLEGGPQ